MAANPMLSVHRRGDSTEIELVGPLTAPPRPGGSPELEAVAVTELTSLLISGDMADTTIHLAADHPAEELLVMPEAVADATGFTTRRDLLQLRRPLPVAGDHQSRNTTPLPEVRTFQPDRDAEAWIRANNRSFAQHPDQGQETSATLADRMAEPWFDADDFLVLDDTARPGELAGFCWTKVHQATDDDPAMGEIYVIGVDPANAGKGLGTPLVLAGLDHLAAKGLTVANLYVEADNAPALRLYDRLDFEVHTRRRVYTR